MRNRYSGAVQPDTRPLECNRLKPLTGVSSGLRDATGADKQEARDLTVARTQDGALLRVGQKVEHSRFGMGTVTKMVDAGDTAKVHIVFENSGEKDLLLKFARLKVLP